MKTISSLPALAAAWRSNIVGCAFRWIKNGQIDTFMALRQYLKDDAARRKTVANAVKGAPAEIREQFMAAAENTLSIFAKGGYLALDEFVTTNIPKEQQEKNAGLFL